MSEVAGKRVVVVGGGVAGLTAAEQLTERGAKVVLIEREEEVGGLARSFRYDGVTFDLGPHRFHTDDAEVERYIRDALGDDQRMIDRSSAVWLYNAYHSWPLERSSLLKLPPLVMIQAGLDLFRRPKPQDESLESYILSRYGQTLYRIFFKPYTEKFLTYRCDELHSDWASAGINRAVIDQRYKFDNLFHVARTTLLPPPVRTQFIYPDSGGIDRFAAALARRIERRGGRIERSTTIDALEMDGEAVTAAVTSGGERVELDSLVWTASLPLLLEKLSQPMERLRYLSELIFNTVIRGRPALPYQWTYYGGAALSFMRASIPSHFSPSNDQPGFSGVCLEVICQDDDELWQNPWLMKRALEFDLLRVGLVRRRDDITAVHFERVPEAYPIYTLDYPGRLKRAVGSVNELSNVHLLGRTGTFWYNNMDHSVRQALDLSAGLGAGQGARSWNQSLANSRRLS